mmetsp:Transcript_2100/g.7846  ORF Transcript_2100/g.7846 Transcript_2100/m.7846 type:complete len:256 (+) Transcript_2100:167-934(+)
MRTRRLFHGVVVVRHERELVHGDFDGFAARLDEFLVVVKRRQILVHCLAHDDLRPAFGFFRGAVFIFRHHTRGFYFGLHTAGVAAAIDDDLREFRRRQRSRVDIRLHRTRLYAIKHPSPVASGQFQHIWVVNVPIYLSIEHATSTAARGFGDGAHVERSILHDVASGISRKSNWIVKLRANVRALALEGAAVADKLVPERGVDGGARSARNPIAFEELGEDEVGVAAPERAPRVAQRRIRRRPRAPVRGPRDERQ